MARSYGRPGHGAFEKVLELRTPPTVKTETTTWKISWGVLSFVTGVVLLIAYAFGLSIAPALGVALLAGSAVSIKLVTRPTGEMDTIRQRVRAEIDYLEHGGDVNETRLEGEQISWALGGIAEKRTARFLEGGLSDVFEVVHDITVKRSGRVSANIDHLVLSPSCLIHIDTKLWKTAPGLVQDGNRVYIPYGNAHWKSVSTCIYEASFLPTPPHALVFALAGTAGRQYRGQVSEVTHYVQNFGEQHGQLRQVPFPVYFVSQHDIVPVVADISNQGRTNIVTAASLEDLGIIDF